MKIKIVNRSHHALPQYATALSAGLDLRANLEEGITLLNTPGTIDADYRGEIGVIMVNLSDTPFNIADGDRIAQLVIARYEQAEWEAVEALDNTERGDGGFGHTGKQ